ncbi:MAG: murein biosynthesis integral membrane protein MurJ [Solirubrobacteraceae bacterium]|nr:murein biosynthesis integral membrane protein MurJ [Solirubrobacteraceae bacterium]
MTARNPRRRAPAPDATSGHARDARGTAARRPTRRGSQAAADAADVAVAAAADAAVDARVERDTSARGRARNTIIFSIATGLSRIAGLIREVFVSAVYGSAGAASAFTLAFTIPNLLRSLFADMALSAAFVPVFTDLLERRRRREAMLLVATLFWVLLGGLALIVAVAILAAPLYMPLFVHGDLAASLGSQADPLTVGLAQVMMPTVLLLGLNGLLVGVLNAYGHFTIPAISPLVWNVVIIAVNIALLPAFGGIGDPDAIYAQAIGVLVGTVVQLLMAVPVLRRYGVRIVPRVDWHDPRLRQVLTLMVPVALSLGLINFSAVINATLGGEVAADGPRGIEAAFRLYMLPQGIFSVAIVTVLFPVLSRAVSRRDGDELRRLIGSGMAQILVLLVPVGMLLTSPVIARDLVELVYQRAEWTPDNTVTAATALAAFGPSLALNGLTLLLSRTFFALQRPWANTALALASLGAGAVASLAMYRPLGIAGIVLGTFVGNVVLVWAQLRLLRRETGGPLRLDGVARSFVQVLVASVVAAAVASGIVALGNEAAAAVDPGLGRSVVTALYLGLAMAAAGTVYVGLARELGLAELEQAGGRFVRLADRLHGAFLRIPGVRALLRIARSGVVAAISGAVLRLLELLAWPLSLLSAIARGIARGLAGMVRSDAGTPPPAVLPGGGASPGASGGGAAAPVVDVAGAVEAGAEDVAGGAGDPGASVAPTAVAPRGARRAAGRRGASRSGAPEGPRAPGAGPGAPAGPRGARRPTRPPADGDPSTTPDAGGGPHGSAPYDGAEDWPTIGQRGGDALDVPWPGIGDAVVGGRGTPGYDPDDADEDPSRLDVYGVARPVDPGPTPDEEARRERRRRAEELLAAREAALERIRERERARREGRGGKGRGRRR